MSSTAIKLEIPISAPANKTFIIHVGGGTGRSYYTYTDALGCKHLAAQHWGQWYRVDPSDVMTEAARSAAVWAGQIAIFEASTNPICSYEYLYERLSDEQSLFETVSKEFPV